MKRAFLFFLFCFTTAAEAADPADGPSLDLSTNTARQVVIAAGTPDLYQGHATTALLADGKTLLAVWTVGHGGPCGPAAESPDGGHTWNRIDTRFPDAYREMKNCPALYRMTDPQGRDRLWVFACGENDTNTSQATAMTRVMSEDNGKSWRGMPALPIPCVMPLCTILRLHDGSYLGLYNDRCPEVAGKWNRIMQLRSSDGGLTWTKPRVVAQNPAMNLCEPFLLRSPDGGEVCAILRDNAKNALSKLIFSHDEGATWSPPTEAAWALTGHRHHGVQLTDGRWVIAFRDTAPGSPTSGHFVAWVGTYDDIRARRPGKRIKLLHSYGGWDCGYASLIRFPDDTLFATTYIKYWNDARKHSIVGVFIKPEDLSAATE